MLTELAPPPTPFARSALSASVATAVVTFPAFLLGGVAVFVARDLHLGGTELGALVSVYFAVCALSSVPVGRLVERFGSHRTTSAGIGLGACSLGGMGLAPNYPLLMLAIIVGGISNALGQLGSNQSLSRDVPAHRQGVAFGIKQAAVPGGTLLAGASVPALAATIGWRWAFGLGGLVALGGLLLVPPSSGRRIVVGEARSRVPVPPLVIAAVAATLAAGSANALSTFLVVWGVRSGLSASTAALMLAAGGLIGVVGRVGSGWWADRRAGGHLLVVSLQLLGGALGLALISAGLLAPIALGTIIGYGIGWSWPGLLTYAVVRANPAAPATATSIVQVGVYAGGAIGPLGFGFLADNTSYAMAWRVGAAAMCVAAAVLALSPRAQRRAQHQA